MIALLATWPRRQFVLVVGGVSLLAVAAVASFAVAPQARRLDAVRHAAPPAIAASSEALTANLLDRDQVMVALSRALSGSRGDLPPREFEAFVVEQLQSNAWRYGVTLNGVVPARGERIEAFREQRFELSLRGSYAGISDWLRALRQELGVVVIKDLRLQRAEARPVEPEDPVIQAELTLASYQVESP
ncbi:MAG: hypothetical protein AAFU65_04710 [Pseudomonadota bacterium]